MVASEVLRRVLESVRQPVQLLASLVDLLFDVTAQGKLVGGEPGDQCGAFGCRQFGRRGWRRRTLVGGKVGNREVCLMTDAADHRHRTSADRPRHSLVVESPEVFDAAATPTDDQYLALATLAGIAICAAALSPWTGVG